MKCPNCHKKIKDNEKLCKDCSKRQNKKDEIKIYIGKNFETILNQKISLPSLLFGPFYLLYRKIYSEAIILILLYLSTTIYLDSNIDLLLKLGINFLIALSFRQLYLNNVQKNISKIKNENSEKEYQKVQQIIKKSGGVLRIEIVIATLFVCLGIIAIINNKDLVKRSNEDTTLDKNIIEQLEYNLPENIKVKENTKAYQYYIYTENNKSCYIIISTNHTAKYKTETEYLVDKKESYTEYEDKIIYTEKINNIGWSVLKLDSKKEDYALKYKNVIYELSFESVNSTSACRQVKNYIMNSIKWN